MGRRLSARDTSDDSLALKCVTANPGPDLTAYRVAYITGWTRPGSRPNHTAGIDAGRARRALDRLEKRGLLTHVDRPADTASGYKRTWHAPPGT